MAIKPPAKTPAKQPKRTPAKAKGEPRVNLLADWVAAAGLGPEVLAGMVTWLAKELVADQHAKLEQGSHTQGGVPLRKVFIDLPISTNPVAMVDDQPQEEQRTLFVATLLETPAQLLASQAIGSPGEEAGEGAPPPSRHRGKAKKNQGFILIGGPGQGKSTVTQLACQLHRAALLVPFIDQEGRLTLSQSTVLKSFIAADTQEELGWPARPLLPIRIVLPEAAAWLAQQEDPETESPVLLRFLGEELGGRVTESALAALLTKAPLLLALDGLDEVGAAEDRGRLLSALRGLLQWLEQRHASGLVAATTRPQGYTGELERLGLSLDTRFLALLRPEEALHYGRRLADAKLEDQDDVHQRVVKGLEAAAKEPATARLLATPLQVTILAVLVQRLGQRVPKERWGLFERYFETIFDREIERNTYASPLLSDHRMHIRQLHARVGLLLQVEFEQSGAEARLPRLRLEQIAEQILSEDGVDEVERAELVRSITRAAKERLVFLVEPEPERFGFEIRSLQEYMAAFALTSGDDELMLARLRQIAKAPTFRAVTLFLASRAFTEGSPLRDALAPRICAELDQDEGDEAARLLHVGASLALELLEEGSVLNQPRYARQLLERACGVLALPPGAEHPRLAAAANRLRLREDPLQAALEEAARVGGNKLALAAWMTLVEAANHEIPWAASLADKLWQELEDAGPLLQIYAYRTKPQWLVLHVENTPAAVRPEDLHDGIPSGSGWLAAFSKLGFSDFDSWRVLGLLSEVDREAWQALTSVGGASNAWQLWSMAADFSLAPSITTLSAVLRSIASSSIYSSCDRLAKVAPWPLAACLRSAGSAADLAHYAMLAESGALGGLAEWLTAESRWLSKESSAVQPWQGVHPLPWNRATIDAGPPLGSFADISGVLQANTLTLEDLEQLPRASLVREMVAHEAARRAKTTSWPEEKRWIQETGTLRVQTIRDRAKTSAPSLWLRGMSQLGEESRLFISSNPLSSANFAWMVETYKKYPELHGFLYWIRQELEQLYAFDGGSGENLSLNSPLRSELGQLLRKGSDPANPALQADAALLRIWTGVLGEGSLGHYLEVISRQAKQEPGIWSTLETLLFFSALPESDQESLTIALLSNEELPLHARNEARRDLRYLFSTRKSGLADPATWRRLKLPLPAPQAPATHHASQLPEHPVVLSRVELQRIRGVPALTLDLSPPIAEDQGQWVVFLGPNGAGKTTLLRALVLALRDLENPKIWPKGTFATPWCSFGASSGRSLIKVQVASGGRSEVVIQRNGSETFKQERRERPGPFPLFAYGCRRGSALGGAARELNTNEDDGPEVATLFDEGAALIHAETWLVSWDGAAAKTPRDAAIYSAVCAALRELLAIDSIEVSDRRVVVSGPGVGIKVPLAALSDGYLTTAGWFLDLIARWIELAQKHGPIGPDFLRRMTGLVLLDEIDLHLHPSWQLQVIPRVKQLLPRMSFVVTTHNPLTLVGARPEEIWVLSSSKGAVHAARGTEVPMLLTGGQILSRYFGIHDLYPHEIGEALRRYGLLSADPRRSDAEDAEMQALRTKLRDHGIDPGWEPIPREQPTTRPRSSATKTRRKGGAP